MKHNKLVILIGYILIIIFFWKIDHEYIHAAYRLEQFVGIHKHVNASKKYHHKISKSDDKYTVPSDLQGWWQDNDGEDIHITDTQLWVHNNNSNDNITYNLEMNVPRVDGNGTVSVFRDEDNPRFTVEVSDADEYPLLYGSGYSSNLFPLN